jgi:hypothetical protein
MFVKSFGKQSLGRQRKRWDNADIDLVGEMGCDDGR